VFNLGLNSATPKARISILFGHTDCVDNETLNAPLRAGRANAAREMFKDMAVAEDLIGPAEAASQGLLPGNDSTAKGRARNRSVVIILMPPPKPEDDTPVVPPNQRLRPCRASADPGQVWALQELVSASLAGGVGVGVFHFELRNRDVNSTCVYDCIFFGFGGGVGAGIALSSPGAETFKTPEFPVNPLDFEGDASIFSASAGIAGVAVEHAFIRFGEVNTEPVEIDLGGLELAPELGVQAGVIGLEGKFFVAEKGRRRGL
jgi:hypothetical protein